MNKIYLEQGLKACRLGREVLLKYLGNLTKVEEKFQAGLVSEADKESEVTIINHLKSHFPDMEFLGEESSYAGIKPDKKRGGEKGRWILDPLDGTTNFVHSFPIFCISLGLEINEEMQVAIIDVPVLGETYTAIKGQGAFVNGRPIHVSQQTELKKSFLATGFFNEDETILSEQLKIFSKLVRSSRAIRRPGAAAYDLCMVAKGVFDGYWERGLKPWDSAAGLLLVREAGGEVLDYQGNEYHPYLETIVAGNKNVAHQLVKEIQSSLK